MKIKITESQYNRLKENLIFENSGELVDLDTYTQDENVFDGHYRAIIVCRSGLQFSAQGHTGSYSDPKSNKLQVYREMEIGYPSKPVKEFIPYIDGDPKQDPTNAVYAYVPNQVIQQVIKKNGGIDMNQVRNLPNNKQFFNEEKNNKSYVSLTLDDGRTFTFFVEGPDENTMVKLKNQFGKAFRYKTNVSRSDYIQLKDTTDTTFSAPIKSENFYQMISNLLNK